MVPLPSSSSIRACPHLKFAVMQKASACQKGLTLNTTCKGAEQSQSYTTLAERCTKQVEIKKSKFIALAAPVDSERSAFEFLNEVSDPRATHNCWAYKIQNTYRFNDDGEPGGTAGKPIYSSIVSSGIDGVMVVVTRYFGGIKLGTGGLARAYGGVSLDCLKEAKTVVVKPKVEVEVSLPFSLIGVIYPLMQAHQAEKLEEEYDTAAEGRTRMKIIVEEEKVGVFVKAVTNACSGQVDIEWKRPE